MQPHLAPAPDKAMVLGKATIRAAQELHLSNAALARVIGLSEPTISRIAGGARGIAPESKEGQLALLVVRLFRGDLTFGANHPVKNQGLTLAYSQSDIPAHEPSGR